MDDIINDEVLGELNYHKNNFWLRRLDVPFLNSNGNLKLVVQDDNKEGILDVQREAYKIYLQNEEKYKNCVTDLLLNYYKWNYEVIARTVSGLPESCHKDVITDKEFYNGAVALWYLFICRDGSFGYAFGCCWDKENGIAVLLSESEPRVISRSQLKNLHKLNDPTVGLLVHDGKNAWKGLEVNKFFGKPENLEIELEGGVDEEITEAQQKAYAQYLEKKQSYFDEFTKMMLGVYVGSDEQAEAMLKTGQKVLFKTVLPKTLFIDKEGNYGWSCYTEWNKDYVDILLSSDKPYVLSPGELYTLSKSDYIIDEEMGVFFDDYLGLRSTIVVRLAGEVRTLPFIIEDTDDQTDISEEKRKSYREYIKLNETLWSDLQDRALTLYLNKYDVIDARYNIPESLKEENVDRTSVMKLVKFRKLYMNFEGRIAWLFEFPSVDDGLAWEFTDGEIELISQPEII